MLDWIRNLDIRKVATGLGFLGFVAHGILSGEFSLAYIAPASWDDAIKTVCSDYLWLLPVLIGGHAFTALDWSKPAKVGGPSSMNAGIGKGAAIIAYLLLPTAIAVRLVSGVAPARAADLAVKAPASQFSLPSAPCLSTACTGFYAGAFFGGLGNNVNVLSNGINGSFNSGGMLPGGDIGWQYYDGKFMFGLEFDGGYQFASSVAVPGSVSFNGPFGIIQAKVGASLSQLAPSFSIPNLPLTIITPYLAGGEMMQQHGGTGGVGGGGIEFQLGTDSSYFLNVEYLNGGGSGQNGNASASQNNIWLAGVNHLF